MKVIGLAGWSGAGKTTLLKAVIPILIARGVSVSTIKHAHHKFDIDTPGKDSYEHRQAGAQEVLLSSGRRWALMHELRDEPEWPLTDLLAKLSRVDLVIIEGFKSGVHPKIEVFRSDAGKPFLHPNDRDIVAIASDIPIAGSRLPVAHLNDADTVADFMLKYAIDAGELFSMAPIAEV